MGGNNSSSNWLTALEYLAMSVKVTEEFEVIVLVFELSTRSLTKKQVKGWVSMGEKTTSL